MRHPDRRPRLTLAFPVRLVCFTAAMAIASCGGQPPAAPDPAPQPPITAPPPGPPPEPSPEPSPEPAPEPSDPAPAPEPVPSPSPSAPTPVVPPPPGSPVFVGAGDIAPCDAAGPVDTARLLDRISGTVFTLGDHTYPTTTREHLVNCYDPTWGRHRLRTRPTLGNHEYEIHGPRDYFDYFGANAGPHGRGYYSFQIGEWLAVSLDSMNGGPDQMAWLRATLAANRTRCIVAYWHHPFVASGSHGRRSEVLQLWRVLHEHGADLVLTAHEHFYERFAPLDAAGSRDPERGMRQFVVGTGGGPLYDFTGAHPDSEMRIRAHGVLKLTLGPVSYAWEFVPVAGGVDFGVGGCH